MLYHCCQGTRCLPRFCPSSSVCLVPASSMPSQKGGTAPVGASSSSRASAAKAFACGAESKARAESNDRLQKERLRPAVNPVCGKTAVNRRLAAGLQHPRIAFCQERDQTHSDKRGSCYTPSTGNKSQNTGADSHL